MKNKLFLLLLWPFWLSAQTVQPKIQPSSAPKSTTPVQIEPLVTDPVTHAVVIGISDYQDPDIPDLRFADRDAEAFAHYLRSPAGGVWTRRILPC